MTMGSMIGRWVSGHPPGRVFLSSPVGSLTFGDVVVARAARRSSPRQAVARPVATVESVLDLLVLPGARTQMVVLAEGTVNAEAAVATAAAAAERNAATILFTSGTSGPPKAVRLTTSNWEAACVASVKHLGHGPDDVWLAAMPLHHVGGLSILYRSAFAGGSVHWLPRFEARAVVEALRRGVTMASFVPTMLRRVLDHDSGTYAGLKAVLVGGGPLPDGLVEEAHERGLPVLPTYGMTETCGQVATLRPGSEPRRAAHPLPGIELRIGAGGRIEVRGPQVSPGYADQDDRPEHDWFVTPDRGELQADGALRVMGRVDDVIVTGGEKVDPGRVEAVLAAHPQVTEVAVVGLVDSDWGHRVVAMYVGEIGALDLWTWAKTRLAPHELPKTLMPVVSIPKTGGDKPDRGAITKMLTR